MKKKGSERYLSRKLFLDKGKKPTSEGLIRAVKETYEEDMVK